MKITINKSTKRVLSLVLAIAMLVGSLFVANAGATFTASAATVEDTWDGTMTAPTKGTGTEQDPYIIENAEQLAFIALSLDKTFVTKDKFFKVADGIKAFNMMGMSDVTMNTTSDVVKSKANAGKAWKLTADITGDNRPYGFAGNFDGNGVTVYNMHYGSGNGLAFNGLFPFTYQEGSQVSTFKNFTVAASYFKGYHAAAGVIGSNYPLNTGSQVVIENVIVKNNYIIAELHNKHAAGLIAQVNHAKLVAEDCAVINNEIVGPSLLGGFFANSSGYAGGCDIRNSYTIGTVAEHQANASLNASATYKYTNVYTDQNVSNAGVTKLTIDQMTGSNATANMSLDFSATWFANTSGAPVLRVFHNIIAVDNEDGTHSGICNDANCGLVGIDENHFYNNVDYTTNTTSCDCGAFVFGTIDVWDGTKAAAFESGTGTEDDPYIIKTVEQLFLMVRSTGINMDGSPIYYEVADSVNALYINDTRAFADQAAFEAAAASLNNWSTGLTTEAQLCGDTANCYCTNYNDVYTSSSTKVLSSHRDGYVDYFGGRFNGNGVTIYGLYSMTTAANHWNNGVGFVPMLTGDAVIKNVTFDTNYVKSNSANVAVISASAGIWDGQYKKDTDSNSSYETFAMCPKVDAYAKRAESLNGAIINVAVRNSYLQGTNYVNNSYISGFFSSINAPASMKITNCLFDGTNSTIVDTASTKYNYSFVSTYSANTNSTVTGCVSITGTSGVAGLNSYTAAANAVVNCYELDSNDVAIEDVPLLNWTNWEIVDDQLTLKLNNSWEADYYRNQGNYQLSYRKNKVLTSTDEYGVNYEFSALRGNRGIFNSYNKLVGSGTEEDPYIINDADTLYMIIASGGTHYGVPQYYQLGCNIDLEGKQWVDTNVFENTVYDVVFYQYLPFAGTIDGAGHTIYNLYSAVDDYAGFIPVLDGGTVKNIHFKNASVASSGTYAGVVTGILETGNGTPAVINCSVEDAIVIAAEVQDELYIVGYHDDYPFADSGIIANSHYNGYDASIYFADIDEESGEITTTDVYTIKNKILQGDANYLAKWYLGAGDDAVPHLIENAKAQPCLDIDGDGLGEEYTARDVSSLKSNLLWRDGYDYIYGDVTGNGTIDMRDLAALQRVMTGQETSELDGFWPNAKAGKFVIYYDENDNYDFARKLELYLERVTGNDVVKSLGSSNANFTISIKTEGDANAYSAAYDAATAKLVIKGGSFTAVEEAVDSFIAQATATSIPSQISGTLASNKQAVTIGGKTYHYAWGDEFNNDIAGTVSYDKWMLRNKGTDSTPGTIDSEFEYIRKATDEEALLINQVQDGKLTLKRGFTGSTNSSEHKFYMSGISSRDSMLFKQGYLEMVAAVPSDGYAFPAWWLLTYTENKLNYNLDNSLYSKVYELNPSYDGVTTTPTGANVQSFKYKLPTQTLEMDLFEIIQRPTKVWGIFSSPSDDHNIKFNIHKWYTYSLDKTDTSMTVYNLDWDNAPASGAFPTKLLTATGSNGENYKQNTASIKINSTNLSTGTVNGAVTYQGSHATMQYDMESLRSKGQITARKYGFLWNEDSITFYVYNGTGADATVLYQSTVAASDLNFGSESDYNKDNYGLGQYAYMLIENHIFTAQKNGNSWYEAEYNNISDCDLVIDYVRIYQLDGHRAIITPESEALRDR